MRTRTLKEIVGNRKPLVVDRDVVVLTVADRMNDEGAGAVLVTEAGRLVGILTQRDLLIRVIAARRDPAQTRVHEVMSRHVIVGRATDGYTTAIDKMAQADIRHLPVTDGERPIGMVTRTELLSLDVSEFEIEQQKTEPALLFI